MKKDYSLDATYCYIQRTILAGTKYKRITKLVMKI